MLKGTILLAVVLMFVTVACSTSQFASYRPAGSNDPNWQINVLHSDTPLRESFKVVINDSTIIDETVNIFSRDVDKKVNYKNKEVKLLVTYSSGTLGVGAGYSALVFVSNELAAKFNF